MRICMKSLLAFFLDHFLLRVSNEPGPKLWVHVCGCVGDVRFDIHPCTVCTDPYVYGFYSNYCIRREASMFQCAFKLVVILCYLNMSAYCIFVHVLV